MSEIEFVSGPHDGLMLSSGLGAPFLWTDGTRCYRAPARGRALYQRMGASSVGGEIHALRFHYAGHTHALCVCGVIRRRGRVCGMCGSAEESLAG